MKLRRLTFQGGWTERDDFETPLRGYRSGVLVELEDGRCFGVTFYDPTRLAQTLADDTASGSPFLAEPGLIVVPAVTKNSMEEAARRLADDGYFDHLVAGSRESNVNG
jgi:hypothetical protein